MCLGLQDTGQLGQDGAAGAGWGHEMGPEMLSLLQHTLGFLPREEGIGAPGCYWTEQSGHRLSTDPEDLDFL